jgi:hypothetical protein
MRVSVVGLLVLMLAGCAGPAAPSSTPSAAASSASPVPSRTCLSGSNHFAGDADNTLPTVCVVVGAVVDLNALAAGGDQVGAGRWTAVTSSDDAVLTCSLVDAHATCRAAAPGHALATATGVAGAWRAQVFVAKPTR